MQAVEITRPGPPDVLRLVERPTPLAAGGEVLIQVEAAGVNRPDLLQRLGGYAAPPGASDLPGLEVAGIVVGGAMAATGGTAGGGSGPALGDAVCALVTGGGYAQYCSAPAAQCLPLPDGLSFAEAAALPETFFTVWSNVFDRARLAPGESLLVQGGASGIGVAAVQLAAVLGHTVYATAGSDERCRAVERLGARRAINHRSEDFVAVIGDATGGRGVDVILDMVGGDYIARELLCLADDGRLALIALLGGARAQIDLARVLRRRLTLTGSTLRPRSVEFKAAIARQLRARVWPLIGAGLIKPMLYRIFPLAAAAAAHQLMESGSHIGKIVLAVGAHAEHRPAS
jgi:NADPH2:quinone reductase